MTSRTPLLARLLLRLYPRRFRAQFGEEVLLLFRDSWQAAGKGPRGMLAKSWMFWDLFRAAVSESATTDTDTDTDTITTTNHHHSRLMRDFLTELKRAARSLIRAPAFTTAVILTLALGIGANTAIFSVVDGVLLRPAPFAQMDRLTMLWETDRKSNTLHEPASIPDYVDFQQRTRAFDGLAAFSPISVTVTPATGDPVRVAAFWVSHEFLPLVGIKPVLGRNFTAEQDRPGGGSVVLISDAFWAEHFARSPTAIGQTIRVSDAQSTIVGVLPPSAEFGMLQILGKADYRRGFADRGGSVRVDMWFPLKPNPDADRGNHPIFVLGRLAPGRSITTAQSEMTAIAADLERSYHDANDGRGVHVEPLSAVVFGGVKPALLVLIGAVSLVLLVACANVANLLLVRGTARLREVLVRTALGASAARLTRQFLLESALLTGAGAVLGVLLAIAGLRFLLAVAPGTLPRVGAVEIDARVLGVTLLLSVFIGLAFGLVPAWQARRRSANLGLQGESGRGMSAGREHRRFRSALVVTELALAVILMVGAGLLIKSLWRLYQVDAGFQTEGVLKAEFQLGSRYPQRMRDFPRWQEIRSFNEEVRRRVEALPGVLGVSISGAHPLEAGYTSSITIAGREAEAADWPEPSIRLVDAGYVPTMRVSVLEGRALSESDDLDAPEVVAINQAARRRFFEGRPALGQRIQLWGRERMVIGVLADEHFHGLAEAVTPALYLPARQAPIPNGSILVRVARNPAGFAPLLRRAVREVDPEIALFSVEPLVETVAQSTAQRRFTMMLLGGFAGVALLLAMVGVHGVLSYSVAQRQRELGIRMALGADRHAVSRLVVGQGVRLGLAGLGLGLLGALAAARLLSALLYGVGASDPLTFASVALLLGGVAVAASWLPARRAAKVDPAVVLRSE